MFPTRLEPATINLRSSTLPLSYCALQDNLSVFLKTVVFLSVLQKYVGDKMSIIGLMRRLSLIGIDAIWQLSLGCLLMRTTTSFQRYTGPYNSRFIANSSSCTTTDLSILLTSCLIVIKNHDIKYCTTVYERNGKKLFWSIKNPGEILNKLKSRGFLASSLSTYDTSFLYTILPHNLIKEKPKELIEQTFNREDSLYLACNDKNAFFYF